MKPNSLIDLYFPAHAVEPERLADAARGAGIDAVVMVADSPDELPPAEEIARVNALGGPQLHAACVVAGAGFRLALLLSGDVDEAPLEAIEASGDPLLIQAAVDELGGCVLPICPRQSVEGGVQRQTAPLPKEPPVGVVALVVGGSRLGRDLDIEDAGLVGRRVLASTGPFGALADFGRYATLLPTEPGDLAGIINSLNQGYGVGVELAQPQVGRPARGPQQGGERKPKKGGRRRRRRRSGGAGKGQAPPAT